MTNIILGNMTIGFLTVLLSNITYLAIGNGRMTLVVEILVACISTMLYYFMEKYNYVVKIRKIIGIAISNNFMLIVAAYLELRLLGLLLMGVTGVYFMVVINIGKQILIIPAIITGMCLPYALICLGIIVGRRKNSEQYEVFLEIEKKEKERIRAYREEKTIINGQRVEKRCFRKKDGR